MNVARLKKNIIRTIMVMLTIFKKVNVQNETLGTFTSIRMRQVCKDIVVRKYYANILKKITVLYLNDTV